MFGMPLSWEPAGIDSILRRAIRLCPVAGRDRSNGLDSSEKQENTPHPARLDRWKRWWARNAGVRCGRTPSALRGWWRRSFGLAM